MEIVTLIQQLLISIQNLMENGRNMATSKVLMVQREKKAQKEKMENKEHLF